MGSVEEIVRLRVKRYKVHESASKVPTPSRSGDQICVVQSYDLASTRKGGLGDQLKESKVKGLVKSNVGVLQHSGVRSGFPGRGGAKCATQRHVKCYVEAHKVQGRGGLRRGTAEARDRARIREK